MSTALFTASLLRTQVTLHPPVAYDSFSTQPEAAVMTRILRGKKGRRPRGVSPIPMLGGDHKVLGPLSSPSSARMASRPARIRSTYPWSECQWHSQTASRSRPLDWSLGGPKKRAQARVWFDHGARGASWRISVVGGATDWDANLVRSTTG